MRLNGKLLGEHLERLGLAGQTVCLHSSLRSFGPVEGGAETLVSAFEAAGCTLIVPAFTYRTHISTPPEHFLPRNGESRDRPASSGQALQAFEPGDPHVTPEMGAIPAALVRHPAMRRSTHPLNSFAALGPASGIVAGQTLADIYAPYKALYASGQGFLLLAGVGLDCATPIHFAEELAGRGLFQRWALDSTLGPVRCSVGGCSDGFERLAPTVADIERRERVGESRWRIFPFREFVEACTERIRREPGITHCEDPACERCRDAVAGGPCPDNA